MTTENQLLRDMLDVIEHADYPEGYSRALDQLEAMLRAALTHPAQPAEGGEVALKVYKGEICYKSKADDQSFGMWCPVSWETEHGYPDGTAFYTAPPASQEQAPIPMVLHCPKCGMQHIDAPDERTPDWKNEPHRSHLCHGCGTIWRPADVPTTGVASVSTKGKADTWEPGQEQAPAYTYASTQATMCASCGEHKHTPLRIDAMGGYVCLTCIDQKLGSLLGEFGYPEPDEDSQEQAQQPSRRDVGPILEGAVDRIVRHVTKYADSVSDAADMAARMGIREGRRMVIATPAQQPDHAPDTRKMIQQPSGGEVVAWRWMPSQVFPQWVYSDDPARVAEAKRFMGEGGVQSLTLATPKPEPMTDEVKEKALDLLATMFDAYENGVPCHEDNDGGYIGMAFKLDDETFHACADVLNGHRPKAHHGITKEQAWG